MRRWWQDRSERGQSVVEFAMVLPLLLVVLFAIVDFGRIYQGHITLTNAAREGARLGAVGGSEGEITARVMTTATGLTPTVVVENARGTAGESVVVTTTATIALITPLGRLMTMIGGQAPSNNFQVRSAADMRLE
jgi:Flp pilus assembly protein TadG